VPRGFQVGGEPPCAGDAAQRLNMGRCVLSGVTLCNVCMCACGVLCGCVNLAPSAIAWIVLRGRITGGRCVGWLVGPVCCSLLQLGADAHWLTVLLDGLKVLLPLRLLCAVHIMPPPFGRNAHPTNLCGHPFSSHAANAQNHT
jgi:hypothetical protein